MDELKKELIEEAKKKGLDNAEQLVLDAWELIMKFLPLYLSSQGGLLKAFSPLVAVLDEPIKQMIDEINGQDDF